MSANRRWLLVGLALAAAGLAFGSKLQLIRAYGSDVPYMDEWDAVGRALLIPRSLGALHASNFLMPQNEHRIVLSRVISQDRSPAVRKVHLLATRTRLTPRDA